MKIICYLSCVLLGLASILNANERAFDLTYETISIEHVRCSDRYKSLEDFDPGHHKTVIRIGKCPGDKDFVLKFHRPLLAKGRNKMEREVSRRNLMFSGSLLGENVPMIFVSSRGYLPGEKVDVVIATRNGRMNSKTISFFPQPLTKEDRNSEAKVTAELVAVSPTNYKIHLEGFREGEKLQFCSSSSGEEIEHELTYQENTSFYYAPGVVVREGGVSRISFIRENGDRISLAMPWGSEFVNHLKGDSKPVVSNFLTISPLLPKNSL